MLENFETVAKAIADPSRVRILKLLEAGELCVCQVTEVLALAPATISKHLSVLKTAGLVLTRKDGRWVYYRLADRALNSYAPPVLDLLRNSLDGDPTIAADRAALAQANLVLREILRDQQRAALCEAAPQGSCG